MSYHYRKSLGLTEIETCWTWWRCRSTLSRSWRVSRRSRRGWAQRLCLKVRSSQLMQPLLNRLMNIAMRLMVLMSLIRKLLYWVTLFCRYFCNLTELKDITFMNRPIRLIEGMCLTSILSYIAPLFCRYNFALIDLTLGVIFTMLQVNAMQGCVTWRNY